MKLKSKQTTYDSVLKEGQTKKKSTIKFSKSYPAYILLVVLIFLSYLVFRFTGNQVVSNSRTAFDKAATSVMTRFDNHYQAHMYVLKSIRNVYDIYVQVVRDYFMLYTTLPLKTYPSILSLMSVQKVPRGLLGDFRHYVMSQGYLDYDWHPKSEDKKIFYLVEFAMPEETSGKLRGFDVSSHSLINREMINSIEKKNYFSTPVLEVRKDTLGVFITSPGFRKVTLLNFINENIKTFEGVVVMEVNLTLMLEQALGSGVTTDSSIIFECFQNDSNNKKLEIFKSKNYSLTASGYTPLLQETREMKIADKNISVTFATIPDFGGSFQIYLPYLALVISLVLSFVFFAFVYSVMTGRARAMELADRMTLSQRRILTTSKDMIGVLETDGTFKSMNPASTELTGYSPEELQGRNVCDLNTEKGVIDYIFDILKTSEDEHTEKADVQILTKQSELKWLNWSFTYSKAENIVFCIGRDITFDKLREEEEKLKSKQILLAEKFSHEASQQKTFFMTKLSNHLKKSLTSINNSHLRLAGREYVNEDEQDLIITQANENTEELLMYVSDMSDFAVSTAESAAINLSSINFETLISEVDKLLENQFPDRKLYFKIEDEVKPITIFADIKILKESFLSIFQALSENTDATSIIINGSDNPIEGAAEIQILCSSSSLADQMVGIYRENSNNLITTLKYDRNDILLNLASAASSIRMMNGSMSLESLGAGEGNLVLLNLPSVVG